MSLQEMQQQQPQQTRPPQPQQQQQQPQQLQQRQGPMQIPQYYQPQSVMQHLQEQPPPQMHLQPPSYHRDPHQYGPEQAHAVQLIQLGSMPQYYYQEPQQPYGHHLCQQSHLPQHQQREDSQPKTYPSDRQAQAMLSSHGDLGPPDAGMGDPASSDLNRLGGALPHRPLLSPGGIHLNNMGPPHQQLSPNALWPQVCSGWEWPRVSRWAAAPARAESRSRPGLSPAPPGLFSVHATGVNPHVPDAVCRARGTQNRFDSVLCPLSFILLQKWLGYHMRS